MRRIAIDLRMVGPRPHGIARYALALWNHLPAHPDRQYLALHRPDTAALAPRRPGDELVSIRSPFLSPLEQLELPLALRRARVDLLHATSFSVPSAYRGPLVVTLHDLTHLEIDELRTPARVAYYHLVVGPAARRARCVLTESQHAKRAIVRALRVPADRVHVSPMAVDLPIPTSARPKSDVPLLLAVGSHRAHKNLGLLVEMRRRMKQRCRLLLVGEGLEGLAAPDVEVASNVDDSRLIELYRQATLFLCPSRTEGFGLPPLEAARLGTPVVVARAGSLEEIWEGAALLLSPDDVDAWAHAVDRLLGDPVAREALAERCIERALRYASWQPLLDSVEAAYA